LIKRVIIDSIQIINANCISGQVNCLQYDEKQGKSIVWSNNNSNVYPIVQGAVNEYAMCLSGTQENVTPGRQLYNLSNKAFCNSDTTIYNYSWTQIANSQMNETYLYSNNNVLTQYKSLPEYPKNDSNIYNYSMFFRSYLQVSMNCRGSMSELQATTSSQEELHHLTYLTYAINTSGAVITFVAALCILCCTKDWSKQAILGILIVEAIVSIFFAIFNVVVKSMTVQLANDVKDTFGTFSDPTSSNDQGLIPAIAGVQVFFGDIGALTAIMLTISCISMLYTIANNCWEVIGNKCRRVKKIQKTAIEL
jgi:hypothetical protein